ncbi:MAG TPA: ABC transporter ATP-binding protein [Egibacteraceae bacterium]|nr:ABC transporter ATP-binding protein [Actinomycetota bacterium]HWB70700.1 ABC transporter ATP-binding protein [Egibacteraceae bacterium]
MTKRYGDLVAVDDLDLEVPAGTVFGFVGPSGSGKTTTIRLLIGIEAPTSGHVRVFGTAPTAFSSRERARIGYMPQLAALYPNLSVAENLNFAASIYGVPLRRRQRLRRALAFVELTEQRRKLVRKLSGGMRRRVALAATLLHDPELLFLDEPTAGIDPVLRRKFWDGFAELQQGGRTLFVTTQYVGEAEACDVVGLISQGRLVAVDSPRQLRRRAYGGDILELAATSALKDSVLRAMGQLPFVSDVQRSGPAGQAARILVDEADTAVPKLQRWCHSQGIELQALQHDVPPFDDVFIELIKQSDRGD